MPISTAYLKQESAIDSTPVWQAISASKRKERDAKIPVEWKLPAGSVPKGTRNLLAVPGTCGILSPREIRLTEDYDAVGLTRLIREEASSSVEIVTAFCKRAAIAHQLVRLQVPADK